MKEEWIPASETPMPEEFYDVLVTIYFPKNTVITTTVEMAYVKDGVWFIMNENGERPIDTEKEVITAWMKKPAPYKK